MLTRALVWSTVPGQLPQPMELPWWIGLPFPILILAIGILPMWRPRWWMLHSNQLSFCALLSLPVIVVLPYWPEGFRALASSLAEYVSFIILLGSFYVVSSGIAVRGNLRARPGTNTALLGTGVLLGNLIGTAGASLLLIRLVLQTNQERKHVGHIPIFFILLVSNLGGVLTPLGSPPLFLGYLNGVEFDWTLRLWPEWLFVNGLVLLVFYVMDKRAYRRESLPALILDAREVKPIKVIGLVHLPFLVGIILAVLLQAPAAALALREALGAWCPDLTLRSPLAELVMLACAGASYWISSSHQPASSELSWDALAEVAILFGGIFVTMTPVLTLLAERGPDVGVSHPWQIFWLSGILSAFVDNAPAYMTSAALIGGPHNLSWLMSEQPRYLAAISCGVVFMGANSYIGNGTNFVVKKIAESNGYRMPSFFGYIVYAGSVLIPIFVLLCIFFFRNA